MLLFGDFAKIGKECRYLEFKSNYQEVDKLGMVFTAITKVEKDLVQDGFLLILLS